MLILLTLILTWIAHNWWKLLLLIVAVVTIHEVVVHRMHKNDGAAKGSDSEPDIDAAADTETEKETEAETVAETEKE